MGFIRIYTSVKLKHWLILITFWAFIAVIITSQLYFNSLKNGLDPAWLKLFFAQLPIWFMWALATPTILFIVNTYPFDLQSWLRSALIYAVLGVVILLVISNLTLIYMFNIYGYLDISKASISDYAPYFFSRFTNDFLIYGLVVLIIVVVRAYTIRKNNQVNLALMMLKNDQLKNKLTESQLQALKLQLNPHFLFNTLNTISSLTLIGDSMNSIGVTTKLGDFLRRTLDYEDHQLVSLEKELEFFDLYLEIESIRFKDRLTLKRNIDPQCLSQKVPNLILQPLIENALKYGISKSANAGLIELNIKEKNGFMIIELFNEGPGLDQGLLVNDGIGLSNVKTRLEKLYEDDHSFQIRDVPSKKGVNVSIHLPMTNQLSAHG